MACGINHSSRAQAAGSQLHCRVTFIQRIFHAVETCLGLWLTPPGLKHTLYLDGPFSAKSQSCNMNRGDRSIQSHQRSESQYNLQFGPRKICVIVGFYCPWTVSGNEACSFALSSWDDGDLCPSCKYSPVMWCFRADKAHTCWTALLRPSGCDLPKGENL